MSLVHSLTLLNAHGDGTKDIKRRLPMACIQITDMEKLWIATHNKMMLRTCIFPTGTYGCETWTLNKNIKKRLNSFENNVIGNYYEYDGLNSEQINPQPINSESHLEHS